MPSLTVLGLAGPFQTNDKQQTPHPDFYSNLCLSLTNKKRGTELLLYYYDIRRLAAQQRKR